MMAPFLISKDVKILGRCSRFVLLRGKGSQITCKLTRTARKIGVEQGTRLGATMGKTIITCAVTGGIHTPTMSDALPVTSEYALLGLKGADQTCV